MPTGRQVTVSPAVTRAARAPRFTMPWWRGRGSDTEDSFALASTAREPAVRAPGPAEVDLPGGDRRVGRDSHPPRDRVFDLTSHAIGVAKRDNEEAPTVSRSSGAGPRRPDHCARRPLASGTATRSAAPSRSPRRSAGPRRHCARGQPSPQRQRATGPLGCARLLDSERRADRVAGGRGDANAGTPVGAHWPAAPGPPVVGRSSSWRGRAAGPRVSAYPASCCEISTAMGMKKRSAAFA